MPTNSMAKLTAYGISFGEYVRRLPIEKCRRVALVGIVFLIITLLGNNFWFFLSPDDVAMRTAISDLSGHGSGQSSDRPRINYDQISGWQLFGEEPAASTEADSVLQSVSDNIDENASETRLNIRLVGIINASDPKEGFAIMQYSGEAALIKVGEPIPVGNDIFLAKVLIDRVIINNRGTFESLKLYDTDGKLPIKKSVRKVSNSRGKVVDKRNDRRVTQLMSGYKRQLLNDPMSMASVIRVSLATDESGDVIGYRVRPGSHRKQFAQLGLKSGDIIMAVNGVSLSNQQNAMQLFQGLGSLTEANFDVKRSNSHLSIMVNLSN